MSIGDRFYRASFDGQNVNEYIVNQIKETAFGRVVTLVWSEDVTRQTSIYANSTDDLRRNLSLCFTPDDAMAQYKKMYEPLNPS